MPLLDAEFSCTRVGRWTYENGVGICMRECMHVHAFVFIGAPLKTLKH